MFFYVLLGVYEIYKSFQSVVIYILHSVQTLFFKYGKYVIYEVGKILRRRTNCRLRLEVREALWVFWSSDWRPIVNVNIQELFVCWRLQEKSFCCVWSSFRVSGWRHQRVVSEVMYNIFGMSGFCSYCSKSKHWNQRRMINSVLSAMFPLLSVIPRCAQ